MKKIFVPALVLALLVACGGGALLALLPVVGPIGGAWSLDTDPATLALDPNNDERFDANPDDVLAYPALSRYTVTGTYSTQRANAACPREDIDNPPDGIADDVPVTGVVDDALLVLRRADGTECLRGQFTDVRTVRVDAQTVFRNSSAQLDLTSHFWVNSDDSSQRFTFTQGNIVGDDVTDTITGCRRTGATRVDITGTIAAFDTNTTVGPEVTLLTIDGQAFTRGTFRGASEIQFGPSGGPTLTLLRTTDRRGAADCS